MSCRAQGVKICLLLEKVEHGLKLEMLKFTFLFLLKSNLNVICCLGSDFLRHESVVIDHGSNKLRIGFVEVCFENLPSECVGVLKSVTKLPVGNPVCTRAELVRIHCGLALSRERQLVKTDEHVMVAPIDTEADSNDSLPIELANTSHRAVSLQPATKLVHLQPFVSKVIVANEDQVDKDAYPVPIEDLELNHLSDNQQMNLLQVLKKHQVWPMSDHL